MNFPQGEEGLTPQAGRLTRIEPSHYEGLAFRVKQFCRRFSLRAREVSLIVTRALPLTLGGPLKAPTFCVVLPKAVLAKKRT